MTNKNRNKSAVKSNMNVNFIPTKCSTRKEANDFKIITFKTHRKVTKQEQHFEVRKVNSNDVDMKKARFEVYKFSKSSLNFSNRQKSNIELAIQLGAKPPKKVATNYKTILADKKFEASFKDKAKFCKDISRNFTATMKHKTQQYKRISKFKNKETSILNIYGKVKPPTKKK